MGKYYDFVGISLDWIIVEGSCTHVQISHLVTSLPTSRQQDVFALLVTSCQQVWNNLLPTCNNLVEVIRLVARLFWQVCYTRKNAQVATSLQTSCCKSVHKLSTSCLSHCLFPVVGTSSEPAVKQLVTSLMALSDLSQCCSIKSDTVMINKNVTRLTTQGCNNTAISWLYRTCSNNLVTSLIISTRLLQIVNSLFQTCWQLGTSSANTTCWRLVGRLATRCEIVVCTHVKTHKLLQVCKQSCYKFLHKLSRSCLRTACSQLL
jgi:hypothetical protein